MICQRVEGLNGWTHLNVLNIQRIRRAQEHENRISFTGDLNVMILKGEVYIYERGTSICDHFKKLQLSECSDKSKCEEHSYLQGSHQQWDAKLTTAESF